MRRILVSNLAAYLIHLLGVHSRRYHWIVEIALFYLVSGVAIVIGTRSWEADPAFGMLTTYASLPPFAALMIN